MMRPPAIFCVNCSAGLLQSRMRSVANEGAMQRQMDNGTMPPDSNLPADAGVPIIIAAETTISGASLLVVAIFAYLKPSLLRILRNAAWLFRGRPYVECKLAEADVISGVVLPLDPQLTAFADRAAAEGKIPRGTVGVCAGTGFRRRLFPCGSRRF